MYQPWRRSWESVPKSIPQRGGAVRVCQACPHPTLSLTLIVVGGSRSEGQEATEACQPQNVGSSFPGWGLEGPRVPIPQTYWVSTWAEHFFVRLELGWRRGLCFPDCSKSIGLGDL